MMRVLAGDIGGTNTRLALYDASGPTLEPVAEATFASAERNSLDEIVAEFLDRPAGGAERAAFGIAGPVEGRRARTTNLPWEVDADRLEQRFGFARTRLLNDLEATAWGIGELDGSSLVTLHSGRPETPGNRTVIAAGTGLGEAGLFWTGSRHVPFATEGGHSTFAPQSEIEWELARFLADRYGHVSWERVLSGPGLVNIHAFLADHRGVVTPAWLAEAMHDGDAAAAIYRAAAEHRDETCADAVRMFAGLYGAEAGNLALKHLARGGVFLGGGIAPKMIPFLQDSGFLAAYLAKGRMRPLVETMPVHVITEDRTALLGAGRAAAELGGSP